jgi:hypothetical protein
MPFINALEILGFTEYDLDDIEINQIKKAKKKLFAEIELSENGSVDYHGNKLIKSDCEIFIEDLDNKIKKDFYRYLLNKPSLNEFLVTGSEAFFESYNEDSIFKNPEFIDFINPFFSIQFGNSFLQAFKNNDLPLLQKILRTRHLINSNCCDVAFKSLRNEIESRIEEIREIRQIISPKTEKSYTNTIYTEQNLITVLDTVWSSVPIDLLNSLPIEFQSQTNSLGKEIHLLAKEIWEQFQSPEIPMRLLEHVISLKVESINKPIFEKHYQQFKQYYENDLEQEKNLPLMKQWSSVISEIRDLLEKVENKKVKPKEVNKRIQGLFNINELNNLPAFADEIRNELAVLIRLLAIASWNSAQDIETALAFIQKALQISTPSEFTEKFNKDLIDLSELQRRGKPMKSSPGLRTVNGIGTKIYGDTLYFVILFIPLIPLAKYSLKNLGNSYSFLGELELPLWQKIWKYSIIAIILGFVILCILLSNNSTPTYSPQATQTTAEPASSPLTESTQVEPYQVTPDTNSLLTEKSLEKDRLKGEIDLEKILIDAKAQNVKAYINELQSLKSTLNEKQSQLVLYKSQIKQIENNAGIGVPIDKEEYKALLDQYNKDVDSYNELLEQVTNKQKGLKNLSSEYESLLKSTNDKIDKYNEMIR